MSDRVFKTVGTKYMDQPWPKFDVLLSQVIYQHSSWTDPCAGLIKPTDSVHISPSSLEDARDSPDVVYQ